MRVVVAAAHKVSQHDGIVHLAVLVVFSLWLMIRGGIFVEASPFIDAYFPYSEGGSAGSE